MITAIILAAGRSTRMGFPKALLRWRGQTFLETIVQRSLTLGLAPLVVTSKRDQPFPTSHGWLEVDAPIADRGPVTSIAAGISAINRPVDGALIWSVDMPGVRESTIRALIYSFGSTRADVVLPTWQGHRGHPLILAAERFGEVMEAAELGRPLNTVVRRDTSSVVEVDVMDPAIVQDVDTPRDYADLIRRNLRSC